MSAFEKQLVSLIHDIQAQSDRAAEVWGDFGNTMIAYSRNQRALFERLAGLFDEMREPGAPIDDDMPDQRIPQHPQDQAAYQQPLYDGPPRPPYNNSYPASSAQAPWPPPRPEHRPPPMPGPAQGHPSQGPNYRLKEALQAAGGNPARKNYR